MRNWKRYALIAVAVAVAGCDGTKPEPLIEYAAVPAIVLSPDQFTVSQRDWLEIARHPDEPPILNEPANVHVSYLDEEEEPWIVRCDREPEGFADCDELERAGLVIVGQETWDAVFAEFGECGSGQCERARSAVHRDGQVLLRPHTLQASVGLDEDRLHSQHLEGSRRQEPAHHWLRRDLGGLPASTRRRGSERLSSIHSTPCSAIPCG